MEEGEEEDGEDGEEAGEGVELCTWVREVWEKERKGLYDDAVSLAIGEHRRGRGGGKEGE